LVPGLQKEVAGVIGVAERYRSLLDKDVLVPGLQKENVGVIGVAERYRSYFVRRRVDIGSRSAERSYHMVVGVGERNRSLLDNYMYIVVPGQQKEAGVIGIAERYREIIFIRHCFQVCRKKLP
jgi:hypothetical protein